MAAKLPEVGEFWEWQNDKRRFRVVYVCKDASHCCIEYEKDGLGVWGINTLAEIATYLPWCKSFDDVEPPKPETETVVFHEVVITGGISGRYIDWVEHPQSRYIPTGRTETRELPKR